MTDTTGEYVERMFGSLFKKAKERRLAKRLSLATLEVKEGSLTKALQSLDLAKEMSDGNKDFLEKYINKREGVEALLRKGVLAVYFSDGWTVCEVTPAIAKSLIGSRLEKKYDPDMANAAFEAGSISREEWVNYHKFHEGLDFGKAQPQPRRVTVMPSSLWYDEFKDDIKRCSKCEAVMRAERGEEGYLRYECIC